MNNTPETAQSTERQPEMARPSGSALSKLRNSLTARCAALLAVLTPAIATGCGEGEDEKGRPLPPSPEEIPECLQPENVTAPAPCAEPLEYLREGNRLVVNLFVPEYDELCKNPLEVKVLGNLTVDQGNGTTDLEPMQELEGVTFVYDSSPKSQLENPYFIDAEVPPGSDITSFAIETEDAYGNKCVSAPVATSTKPMPNPGLQL